MQGWLLIDFELRNVYISIARGVGSQGEKLKGILTLQITNQLNGHHSSRLLLNRILEILNDTKAQHLQRLPILEEMDALELSNSPNRSRQCPSSSRGKNRTAGQLHASEG